MAEVTTGSDTVVPKGSLSPWVVTGRLRALTIPVVTVLASPSGLPTAMTGSPTETAAESAIAMGARFVGGFLRVRTARSVEGSVPAIVASYVRPSDKVTVIDPPDPPAVATWLFVRM